MLSRLMSSTRLTAMLRLQYSSLVHRVPKLDIRLSMRRAPPHAALLQTQRHT